MREYNAFSKAAGLKTRPNRMRVVREAGNPLRTSLKADILTERGRYKKDNGRDYIRRVGNNTVDSEYIHSDEYCHKFDKLSDNRKLNSSIRKTAQSILTHRTGSDSEDLYIFDLEGNILFREIGLRNKLEVSLAKEKVEFIRENYPYRTVSLHNHPTNIPPTGSDFGVTGYRKYCFGVVVTHDGRVYKYSVGTKPFQPSMLDAQVMDYQNEGMPIEEAHAKALKNFSKAYGINWEEIE